MSLWSSSFVMQKERKLMKICNDESKNKRIAKVNIIIYFLLLFKAGFFFNEQYTAVTAPLYLVVVLLFNGKRVLNFDRNKSALFLYFIILLSLNYLINGFPTLASILLMLLNMVTALLISNVVDEYEFCDSFRRVIFSICIASIFGFIIMCFFKGISAYFPALVNSTGRIGRYAVLTTLSDFTNAGMQRVQGIFWEPGAFQAMIVFSVVFEIYKTKTLTYKRMIVYVLTMVLTFSTTGYVCLMLLIVLAVNKDSRAFTILKSILIFGAVLIFYLSLQSETNSFLQYTLFGKFQMILNYQEGVSTHASSRIDSIIFPLRLFVNNPIMGIGEDGYAEMARMVGHRMFTCTPVNYFAKYGLIVGGLSVYGMYKMFAKEKISMFNGIILSICLLITLSTEAFTFNPILTCMIFYGYGYVGKTKGALK